MISRLKKSPPSRAILKAFQEGLEEMVELGRAPEGLSTKADAQQIFTLSLPAIVDGKGLKEAQPVAWDFLMGGGSTPTFLVAVSAARGSTPRMTSLTREPMAAQAAEATSHVENLPHVRKHRYDLRRLRIPALSLGAFWLKSLERGVPDLAVPYHAIHNKLKSMQACPMDEFLAVVRPIAQKRLADEAALRRKAKASRRG